MGEKTKVSEEPINPWFLAEVACWTMVLLAPLLTWVNGPAVSPDQAVLRTVVFVSALAGAVGLRLAKIVRRRRHGNESATREGRVQQSDVRRLSHEDA